MASTITDRVATAVGSTPVSEGGGGYGMVQCTSVAGTDTITANTVPQITAYTTYGLYILRPAANNTGAVTLALQGLSAKAVKTPSGAALAANDLDTDLAYILQYDGTDFRILSPFF